MTELPGEIKSDGKNFFERIVEKIPGIKGYTQKEDGRETDHLLRETLAAKFEEQWARINGLQRSLLKNGGIELIDDLETAAQKVRQFADRVKTATYGYGGMLDLIKVDNTALEKIYQYDASLLDLADSLKNRVDELEIAITSNEGVEAAIAKLTEVAQNSISAFNGRSEILKN